jgi:hypothetical protein
MRNLCSEKTGFNGGIDVYLEMKVLVWYQLLGSIITIRYLLTDGSLGNIFRRTNDWSHRWYYADGEIINIDKVFNVEFILI